MYYERVGEIPNVVFICGAILERDGGMKIYYGATDTSICLAAGTHIDEIFSMIKSVK